MSRNAEKAQSMLYRWKSQQASKQGITDTSGQRPKNITNIDSPATCEKWRNQVVKELTRKIDKINDASLTDFQVRDLNDEINKLQKEKYVWEIQLRNLGGTNYIRTQSAYDTAGRTIGSHKGYKYYGRAKELPGIKELFSEPAPPPKPKRTKEGLLALKLDSAYYGFADETDPKLLAYEKEREEEALENLADVPDELDRLVGYELPTVHDIPTKQEIEAILVEARKAALLARYS